MLVVVWCVCVWLVGLCCGCGASLSVVLFARVAVAVRGLSCLLCVSLVTFAVWLCLVRVFAVLLRCCVFGGACCACGWCVVCLLVIMYVLRGWCVCLFCRYCGCVIAVRELVFACVYCVLLCMWVFMVWRVVFVLCGSSIV